MKHWRNKSSFELRRIRMMKGYRLIGSHSALFLFNFTVFPCWTHVLEKNEMYPMMIVLYVTTIICVQTYNYAEKMNHIRWFIIKNNVYHVHAIFPITGDLHPGNVFVSPDGKKFILFDVGIVNEYSDADHQLIVDVLASFVRKDGRKAGRLMIDDSNIKLLSSDREDYAVDEENYIDKIEELTIRASTKGYLMEHLGTYITHICDAASQHHVMMNPAFISAALAVKVQEGIALAMDPSVKIPNIAIPIIIKSEARRKVQSNKSDLLTSLQQFMDTIFLTSSRGDKNNNATATAPTNTPSPTTNNNSQNRGKAAASQGQAS